MFTHVRLPSCLEQRFFIKPTEISQSTDNQSCQQIGYAQTGGAVRNKMAKEFKKVDAYHLEEKKWNSGHEDFYASKCPLDQSKNPCNFSVCKTFKIRKNPRYEEFDFQVLIKIIARETHFKKMSLLTALAWCILL